MFTSPGGAVCVPVLLRFSALFLGVLRPAESPKFDSDSDSNSDSDSESNAPPARDSAWRLPPARRRLMASAVVDVRGLNVRSTPKTNVSQILKK